MSNQEIWDRLVGRDPNIRAADADRDRIAERLRKGHAEGRLDLAEFQQRLDRCLQAKTYGELGLLVRDLPREESPAARRLPAWRWRLAPLASVLIALLVVSAAMGHHAGWLWIPAVFLLSRMFLWRHRRGWSGPRRGPREWL